MTEITSLLEPSQLTTSLAILLIGILFVVVYLGIKLRSALVITMFSVNMIVFILIILINLAFVWLWLTLLLTAISISIAGVVYYL